MIVSRTSLGELGTRFVVPLLAEDSAPPRRHRLNPAFAIGGKNLVMVTQYATTVPVSEFRDTLASLEADYLTVTNALDRLITGV